MKDFPEKFPKEPLVVPPEINKKKSVKAFSEGTKLAERIPIEIDDF